jgi:hypothetical protein
MNPASNEAAGMQLPPPIEQAHAAEAPVEVGQKMHEKSATSGPELAVSPSASAMPIPAIIPLPTVTPIPNSASQIDATNTTQISGAQIADDGDLIEKEWVVKAKAIVEHNREDPYKQSEELTVFKADYMQKRYNKIIKLNK